MRHEPVTVPGLLTSIDYTEYFVAERSLCVDVMLVDVMPRAKILPVHLPFRDVHYSDLDGYPSLQDRRYNRALQHRPPVARKHRRVTSKQRGLEVRIPRAKTNDESDHPQERTVEGTR